MIEGNQLNGVYGLPQGWASPSTHVRLRRGLRRNNKKEEEAQT